MNDVKDRFKLARKNLNLTQQELATALTMSRSNICNIESGTVKLTERNMKDLCLKYNVNEEWLKTGEGTMFSNLTENEQLHELIGIFFAENDTFKKEFITQLLSLDQNDWIVIKKFIDTFKKKE